MKRLLDDHDPPTAKLARDLLFSYTCKDGSEVLADSFRISGLTVILKAFHKLRAATSDVEACIDSMARYVRRSARQSPRGMREPGDACRFMLELVRTSRDIRKL